ncbi:hypothetical protein J0J24_24030, partial [Vibrio vulnificus]|nr:hypothetical protein [Vibrio vulnificus]
IDIHSQHQTHELSDETYQIQILDAVAGNFKLLDKYQSNLKIYKGLQSSLKQLLKQQADLLKEHDYNTFLLEELEAANLAHINQEELEEEYE